MKAPASVEAGAVMVIVEHRVLRWTEILGAGCLAGVAFGNNGVKLHPASGFDQDEGGGILVTKEEFSAT